MMKSRHYQSISIAIESYFLNEYSISQVNSSCIVRSLSSLDLPSAAACWTVLYTASGVSPRRRTQKKEAKLPESGDNNVIGGKIISETREVTTFEKLAPIIKPKATSRTLSRPRNARTISGNLKRQRYLWNLRRTILHCDELFVLHVGDLLGCPRRRRGRLPLRRVSVATLLSLALLDQGFCQPPYGTTSDPKPNTTRSGRLFRTHRLNVKTRVRSMIYTIKLLYSLNFQKILISHDNR